VIGSVLKEYGRLSGQKVNVAKSHISYGDGVPSRIRRRVKRILHMNETHCLFKYLGVNIGMRRLPRVAFEPLLERLRAKISSWKGHALSFAGKVNLIQAVFQLIPIYLLSSGWVPKTVLVKMDEYCRRFLWSRDGDGHGLPLAAWRALCKSKDKGGLGFRRMSLVHEALLRKQLAKYLDKPSSLWTRVI